jgi:hypothetical protein
MFAVLLIAVAVPQAAGAADITYSATRDWYIDSAHPSKNFFFANVLRTDAITTGKNGDSDKWTLLHFRRDAPGTPTPAPGSTFRYIELCMHAETSFLPRTPKPYWAVYESAGWFGSDDQVTWNNHPAFGSSPLFVQGNVRWRVNGDLANDTICQHVTGPSDYLESIWDRSTDVMVKPYGDAKQSVRWTSREGSINAGHQNRDIPWLTVVTTRDSGTVIAP